ncbi:hypothetical protein [Sphingomonas profundi]|uniref:hypothetical protein n=1 Tax=Alterirhizorhabdus profundi TaxID=2681549 RepID=UPI001E6539D3|nr:hypothetical protein [Sphingomonas profundi]
MADEPRLMHGDETMSPVDLPGSTLIGGRPLLWTTTAIYLAAAFLLLTNASAINGWAVELPPTATTARLVAITEGWQATTDRLGLGAPRALVNGWWKRAQAARFGSERP